MRQSKTPASDKKIREDTRHGKPPFGLLTSLERKGMSKISLHGEGAEMVQWSSPLDEFNSDQTSLFYSKIPNMIYGGKEAKNNLAGVKEMKSKDRITLYKVAVNPAVFVVVKGLFECNAVP